MVGLAVAVLIWSVLPLVLAGAAISDLFTMTIPNRLSAIALMAFLILAPLAGLAWSTIGMSLAAGLLVFAFCFALFAFNIMGGGDAKLLTVTAIWFGFDPSLLVFLVTVAYVGGGVTLLFLLLRTQASTVMALGVPLPVSLIGAKKIPYGIAIAIGGFLSFPEAPILQFAMHVLG